MGKASRDKGARGEREVAELLRAVYPNARRRACGEEAQQDQGRDLKRTGRLVVQCQLAKRPTPERKFNEACDACVDGSDQVPVAFTRRCVPGQPSAGEWLVTLHASHFLELLQKAGIEWLG